MSRSPESRRAGILLPLFSVPSSQSWGIGEFTDFPRFGAWLERGGQRVVVMLPLSEMPPGETSPYSALSVMAIDPQFITLDAVDDFRAIGGEPALEPELRDEIAVARAGALREYISAQSWWLDDYALFRALKKHHGKQPWLEWPEPIRVRRPEAL